MPRPEGAENGCPTCPYKGTVLPRGTGAGHHFCEAKQTWTNLLVEPFVGSCLFTLSEDEARLAGKPHQPSLF